MNFPLKFPCSREMWSNAAHQLPLSIRRLFTLVLLLSLLLLSQPHANGLFPMRAAAAPATAPSAMQLPTELRLCYIPDSRSVLTDDGYTLDGARMSGHSTPKLTNTSNFGPSGVVTTSITIVPLTDNPITGSTITSANCGGIFVGSFGLSYDPGPPLELNGTAIGAAELAAIRDWSIYGGLVVISQTEADAWGYDTQGGNTNPNVPTAEGAALTPFNGPFGSVTSFEQGGGYQAQIASSVPSTVLARDNNDSTSGSPTIVLDLSTNDIILADVDIITDLGGLSSGGSITNNNDRLFANIWTYAIELAAEDYDNDGVPDGADPDDDGDGIPDVVEGTDDDDGDAVPNARDLDSDNDGINDVIEAGGIDADGDGMADGTDGNGDGMIDTPLTPFDSDSDGVDDYLDLDSDNDGIGDLIEGGSGAIDADNDGVADGPDNDGDGIVDSADGDDNVIGDSGDLGALNSEGFDDPDYLDPDSNNDGTNDIEDAGFGHLDSNGDGALDSTTDDDGDGIANVIDGDGGTYGGFANPPAQVALLKSVAPASSVEAETMVSYTLTISNAAVITATNVVVTDTIPAGLTGLSASNSFGVADPALTAGTTASWAVGDLAPYAAGTIVINATAPAATATLTNTAGVTATNDFTSVDNVDSVVLTIIPPPPPGSPLIDTPIADDDFVNAAEAVAVPIAGTGVSATSQVEVLFDDGVNTPVTVAATVNPDGSWAIAAADVSGLNDGTITIRVTETDQYGQPGTPATTTFELDTTAPTAPVMVAPAAGEATADATPTISGTAENTEAGATITVTVGGSDLVTTVGVDGSWTVVPAAPLAEGAHTPTVAIEDVAGNVTGAVAGNSFTVDTTAPAPAISGEPANHDGSTSFTFAVDFGESVSGFVAGDITVDGGAVASVTGGPQIYTVAITPSGEETINITIPAGAAQDSAGNANTSVAISVSFERPLSCNAGQGTNWVAPAYPIEINNAASVVNAGLGLCLFGGCSISNKENVVDSNVENFATINLSTGLGASGTIAVRTTDGTTYPAGSFAGFVMENPNSLIGFLNAFTIETYLAGSQQESRSASNLLNLFLFNGASDKQTIGFNTTQPFDEVRVVAASLLSVGFSANVYHAQLAPASCVDSDDDGDGVNNTNEIEILGTDPNNADSDSIHTPLDETANSVNDFAEDFDGDGWSNGEEIAAGTDPLDAGSMPADDDGEGISDADETGILGTDPTDPDSDSVLTVPDEGDNGVSDLAEDFDGDGWNNGEEIASGSDPLDANSTPDDNDGDGVSNADEVNILGTDPNDADSNSVNTIADESNNSINDANEDFDGDGFPNGVEIEVGADPLNLAITPDDLDGDGFSNDTEILAGSNPLDADSTPDDLDGDGISNVDETGILGTDPTDADSDSVHTTLDENDDSVSDFSSDFDGDGWSNGAEIAAGTDPLDAVSMPADEDGEGISDIDETDILGTDPTDIDSDSSNTTPDESDNGVGDAEEDFDGDGWSNGEEIASGSDPLDASSTPDDFDGDGISNADEVNILGTDPTDADSDSIHTTPDENDNGVGDAEEDFDGDGWSNGEEIAVGSDPLDENSTPTDSDGDSISNADEVNILETDLNDPDSDADTTAPDESDNSISDYAEDFDGDGWSNGEEIASGSDPLDENSVPTDNDGDGISNADEVNILGTDPDVADSDSDNTAEDESGNGIDDGSEDFDDDSFTNEEEIEAGSDVFDGNVTPDDLDGDGFTNAEETAAGSDLLNEDSTPDDLDGDGISNVDETGLLGTDTIDPDSDSSRTTPDEKANGVSDIAEDFDGDGWSNGEEIAAGSSPLDETSVPSDSDGDGISDIAETTILGTDPNDPDSDSINTTPDESDNSVSDGAEDFDGDGWSNGEEIAAGSDPLDRTSVPDDADGDGISNADEVNVLGTDPNDPDSDSVNTTPDENDNSISDFAEDFDGDGWSNGEELAAGSDPLDRASVPVDSDGDGISNADEVNILGTNPNDSDSNSVHTAPNENDNGLDDANEDFDGDGVNNDDEIRFGTDPFDASSLPGDSDGDGVNDANEDPNGDGDPTNDDTDGDGIPNYLDTDDDGDGILTAAEDRDGDGDPGNDDTDGDKIPDYLDVDDQGPGAGDSDGDGVPDDVECQNGLPCINTDGDLIQDPIPDYLDNDDDGDGILSLDEDTNGDRSVLNDDTDGDGIPNYLDWDDDGPGAGDSDGDGVPDDTECPNGVPCPDSDGDTYPDYMDTDDDNDGVNTADEDGNGNGNPVDDDDDGDGIPNYLDDNRNAPGDGDSDGDGLLDLEECPLGSVCRDTDGDGILDYLDADDDGDGISTADEIGPLRENLYADDDGDGIPNYLDVSIDSDGDGLPDYVECPGGIPCPDGDMNGIPAYMDRDELFGVSGSMFLPIIKAE